MTCSFQASWLSIIIPKNFVCDTTGKGSLSIFSGRFVHLLVDFLGKNNIATIFCILRDNLLALNHELRFSMSSWII